MSGIKFTNATTKATFIAKLDANGQSLWAQLLTGDLYSRQLAVDPTGNVILSGRYTSELHLAGLLVTANEFGGAAVAKISVSGAPQWLRSWRKGGTVSGSVDIYQVTADALGIYVAGAFNQSIQFGSFSANVLAPPFRDLRWVGKLDADGNPQWLQTFGGGIPTGLATSRDGSLWVSGYDDALAGTGQVVGRASSSTGTFTTNYVFGRSQSAIISQGIFVDDQNHVLTGGHFIQAAQFGSTIIGNSVPGDGGFFSARFTPAGETLSALQTARNFISGAASEIFVSAFTGDLAGDAYYAGYFRSGLRLGTNSLNAATRRVFVAKVAGPGRLPFFIQQPAPATAALGGTGTFSVVAGGDPTLVYEWFKNSVAIPQETGATLTLKNVSAADTASYTVTVSNARDSISSGSVPLNINSAPAAPALGKAVLVAGGKIAFTLSTQVGVTYVLEFRTSLDSGGWRALQTIPGDGSVKTLEVAVADKSSFFRILIGM